MIPRLQPDLETFKLVKVLTERDAESGTTAGDRAWAHATLAEFELIGKFHASDYSGSKEAVQKHCQQIISLMGSRSFHVGSTLRQFERYVDAWDDDLWRDIAKSAIGILKAEENGEYEWPE